MKELINEAIPDELESDEESEENDGEEMSAENAEETGGNLPAEKEEEVPTEETGTKNGKDDPSFFSWYSFFIRHPDISAEQLPACVIESVANGAAPETAYELYQAQERIAALETQLKKQNVRFAAPGSLMPTAAANPV